MCLDPNGKVGSAKSCFSKRYIIINRIVLKSENNCPFLSLQFLNSWHNFLSEIIKLAVPRKFLSHYLSLDPLVGYQYLE